MAEICQKQYKRNTWKLWKLTVWEILNIQCGGYRPVANLALDNFAFQALDALIMHFAFRHFSDISVFVSTSFKTGMVRFIFLPKGPRLFVSIWHAFDCIRQGHGYDRDTMSSLFKTELQDEAPRVESFFRATCPFHLEPSDG